MTAERPIATALENRLMSHGIYVLEFTWMDGETTDSVESAAETAASSESVETAKTAESKAETPNGGETGVTHPDDGDGIALEYETVAEAAGVTSDEVSAVVRTLLSIADQREWTPGRLEATSLTTDGERRGRWRVERDWFEELGTTLSEIEFSQRVLETVEPAERESQVD